MEDQFEHVNSTASQGQPMGTRSSQAESMGFNASQGPSMGASSSQGQPMGANPSLGTYTYAGSSSKREKRKGGAVVIIVILAIFLSLVGLVGGISAFYNNNKASKSKLEPKDETYRSQVEDLQKENIKLRKQLSEANRRQGKKVDQDHNLNNNKDQDKKKTRDDDLEVTIPGLSDQNDLDEETDKDFDEDGRRLLPTKDEDKDDQDQDDSDEDEMSLKDKILHRNEVTHNGLLSPKFEAKTEENKTKKQMNTIQVVDDTKSSVVAISNEKVIQSIFGEFSTPTAGSGFLISPDGYIVTNNHVVEGSNDTKVTLDDGRIFSASIVGTDPLTDIAVLKIDTKGEKEEFDCLSFGRSDDLKIGEDVLAIGNPTGTLQGSVSNGIISALNRTIPVGGVDMAYIQTNAAINSGNSGGPLIDAYGDVIGINAAKISGSPSNGGFEGLGFAIPSDTARPVIEHLIRYGYVKGRTYLGILCSTISKDAAKMYGIGDRAGVMIEEVVDGSSAQEAGLRAGDLIIGFSGEAVTSFDDINNIKKDLKPGDKVEIIYLRQGQKRKAMMTLQEYVPDN